MWSFWSFLWDSNPQPADYKSAALPIELLEQTSGKNMIQTYEAEATDLQSAPFDHSGTFPTNM